MKQKDGVHAAYMAAMAEGLPESSSAFWERVLETVCRGLMDGSITHSTGFSDAVRAMSYSKSLVSNWRKRDLQLNGGAVAQRPSVQISAPADGIDRSDLLSLANTFRASGDGQRILKSILQGMAPSSGPRAVEQVIASLTLFSHPDTVAQTKGSDGRICNLFAIVRTPASRDKGKLKRLSNGAVALFDDNACVHHAFCWSNMWKISGRKDVQFNHLFGKPINAKVRATHWSDGLELQLYTSLANLCVTPSFLAKLTDTDTRISDLLKYRAYELFGQTNPLTGVAQKPEGYDDLVWAEPLPAVDSLEKTLRAKLNDQGSNETIDSVRKVGWLFSDFRPEPSIGKTIKKTG